MYVLPFIVFNSHSHVHIWHQQLPPAASGLTTLGFKPLASFAFVFFSPIAHTLLHTLTRHIIVLSHGERWEEIFIYIFFSISKSVLWWRHCRQFLFDEGKDGFIDPSKHLTTLKKEERGVVMSAASILLSADGRFCLLFILPKEKRTRH